MKIRMAKKLSTSLNRIFGHEGLPSATIVIFLINLSVFIVWQLSDGTAMITTIEYGHIQRDWNGMTLFTYMFLHAGLVDLLSNLLVLSLLGLMAEKLMGSALFVGVYLASGVISAALSLLINTSGLIPVVGSSGAISGVLGMVTVIFWRKKLPIFKCNRSDSKSLAMPVFLLVMLWFGIEIVRLTLNNGSQLHILAHFGCFLSGTLVAMFLRQTKWISRIGVAGERFDCSGVMPGLVSAEDHCRCGNHREAIRILRRIFKQECRDFEVLTRYYKCSRISPEGEDFHRAAHAIFNMENRDEKSVELIRKTYLDYVRLAQPAPRFNEKNLFRLADLFVDRKWCDEVDGIMSLMYKKKAACLFATNLPYRYAKLLDEQGRTSEGTEYLKNIG